MLVSTGCLPFRSVLVAVPQYSGGRHARLDGRHAVCSRLLPGFYPPLSQRIKTAPRTMQAFDKVTNVFKWRGGRNFITVNTRFFTKFFPRSIRN